MEVAGICGRCKLPRGKRAHICDHCLIDLWCEAQREVRQEMMELFRSELTESTEAIWQRITK